jgi:hypothetical protein
MGAARLESTGDLYVVEQPGKVVGTYADEAAYVDFRFSLDGDVRTAVVRDGRGTRLVESSLADGIETTTYLGRLTIFGPPRSCDPRVVGDKTAMADLAKRPEAALFPGLRDALEDRGISRALFAAPRVPAQSMQLGARDCVVISTWSWWWSCAIELASAGPSRFQVKNGNASWADTASGRKRLDGPWSSWNVTVTNLVSTGALVVENVSL